ncbi:MAG: prenyltransferase/squalene oxidase repeat-containing protein [Planctomycetota bacterium]|nr:prenyltransferase/squalene oxidase repeat-containing protein [Planctomycetota bacterium]
MPYFVRMALVITALLGLLAWSGPAAQAGDDAAKPRPKERFETESNSVAEKRSTARGWENVPLPPAAKKGIKWLIVNQNADGGWGQEGRLTKNQKQVSRPVGTWRKSDVGNTCFAALAILGTGSTPSKGTFQGPLKRAVLYVLANVDRKPSTSRPTGRNPTTQIHGKIGRYAPTFLAARLFLEVEGAMPEARQNRQVTAALREILPAIERLQAADGSWNHPGTWAPIHSTAYASQALWEAKKRGHKVTDEVLAKAERFTIRQLRATARAAQKAVDPKKLRKRRGRGGKPPVITPGPDGPDLGPVAVGSAGVVLYSLSQAAEQLTRTPDMRKRFTKQIEQIADKVQSERVLKGLGSMGGEEFISYANINVALARMGGKVHTRWDRSMKSRLAEIQNRDGSWSGHHCITGRTAVTSLAVLTLTAERQVPRK